MTDEVLTRKRHNELEEPTRREAPPPCASLYGGGERERDVPGVGVGGPGAEGGPRGGEDEGGEDGGEGRGGLPPGAGGGEAGAHGGPPGVRP